MKKRISALLLTLALCLGLTVSAGAFDMGRAGAYNIISCGGSHTAAIDKSGSLWMWGYNSSGQLGNGSQVTPLAPVKVLDNVASVNCGNSHTAAIKTDGSLWMWGHNEFGQLGNGSTTDSSTPVKVMDSVAAVSCGDKHTAAIKTDGSLWMWGHNSYGQLGNGGKGNNIKGHWENTVQMQTVPVKVLDGVVAVSCGYEFTAALKADNSLWMWGINRSGQLGNGGKGNTESNGYPIQTVPVKVLDGVAAVSCSGHTAAVKTDGSLWTWGLNASGQLGNGGKGNENTKNNFGDTVQIQTVPVKVIDSVAAVSCGGSHTAAVKTDGSLWAWGTNASGQLGNSGKGNENTKNNLGDTVQIQTVPVKVLDKVSAVSCGGEQTAAVKTDGSLWSWGKNNYGQLGIGGFGNVEANGYTIQTVPAQVKGLTLSVSKTPPAKTETAMPTNDKLTVNGKPADPTVYKIGGSNYFKIRDVAALLNGTGSQFSVGYDSALKSVTATTGQGYTKLATDLTGAATGGNQTAAPSNDVIYVNGKKVEAEVYKIGGSNYFKLRDLGAALGFDVGWSKETGVYIETK